MNLSRLVVVHSLTAHGVVGLKAFLPVLGELCLPVPSVLLTGPGDMPGCARFEYDFAAMLRGTLAAAAARGERVGVFVGYLSNAAQIAAIAGALDEHRQIVDAVFIDPVCGDDGRAYVAPALIAAWPHLLARADWMFPNLTEAQLLSGENGEAAIAKLRENFPYVRLVLTGCPAGTEIETRLYGAGLEAVHRQARVAGRFNGTGDLFAALFLRAIVVEKMGHAASVGAAAEGVARAAELAVARGVRELSVRAIM